MYSQDELRDIYRRLSEPFPEEAIERTKGKVTGRGYDTSGVKVQYVINRLNDVLGLGGFRVEPDITVRERPARNGRTVFEAVCDITMQLGRWEDGSFVAFAEAPATGGHVAALEADARKGALSNSIKKAAAAFGVAWQAFAGRLDEDNSPAEQDDWHAEESEHSKPVQRGDQRPQENGRITSSRAASASWNGTEPPIALAVSAATRSPTPRKAASSSMPSLVMTVESTSKQTASAF